MPEDLRCKTIKLRWGDIQVRTRRNLTAVDWMDKRDVCMLTNIHDPPQEGNFHNEQGNVIKPKIVADYKHHLDYVDKGNRMANSYTISHQTWKWMKMLLFHLFKLAILNSYILLSSCGGKKISHRHFGLALLSNMLELPRQEQRLQRSVGRSSTASVNISTLDTSFNKYWPGPSKPGCSHVCRHDTESMCDKSQVRCGLMC